MSTPAFLFKTVAKLGLTKAQARHLLPDWWSEEIERDPGGIQELGLHLSRRLSLDYASLSRGEIVPTGAVAQVAYKHSTRTEPAKLTAASYVASSVTGAILAAMRQPYRPFPRSAKELASEARAAGNGVIGFDSLLTVCWSHGVPVVPLPNLPNGMRKMDGAALSIGNRPAIVLAKRRSSRAWLLFILAHEIGHIALRHVEANSSIIDVSLEETATYSTESSSDSLEAAADNFALVLMGGKEVEDIITGMSSRLPPVEIATAARAAGNRIGVEPGHFVLRYAFHYKRWAEAMLALRFLSEDLEPQTVLAQFMQREVDLDLVSSDLQEWIPAITGLQG